MSIEEINNYLKISERLASSGQPEKNQFSDIADAGFQVVINLAMPDSVNAIPEEGNIVTAHKMAYVHIPVPFDSPGIDHLRQFINIMQACMDRKIWVHCVFNYRVSAFLYQYLQVAADVSEAQARKALLPSWQPDDVWQRFMAITRAEIAT